LRRKRQKVRRGGTEYTVEDKGRAADDEGALKGSSVGIDKRTV